MACQYDLIQLTIDGLSNWLKPDCFPSLVDLPSTTVNEYQPSLTTHVWELNHFKSNNDDHYLRSFRSNYLYHSFITIMNRYLSTKLPLVIIDRADHHELSLPAHEIHPIPSWSTPLYRDVEQPETSCNVWLGCEVETVAPWDASVIEGMESYDGY